MSADAAGLPDLTLWLIAPGAFAGALLLGLVCLLVQGLR